MSDLKAIPTVSQLQTLSSKCFHAISILKLSVCKFLALKTEFRMNEAIEKSEFTIERKIEWKEKVGTSWGRFGSMSDNDGEIIKLVFIRHPSSYFNAGWADFIAKYIPTRMAWLKSLNT